MRETAEIIKAFALLCWPICILAIAYIFRAEIKKLISKDKQHIDSEIISQNIKSLHKIEPAENIKEISSQQTNDKLRSDPIQLNEEPSNLGRIKNYISVCKNKKSGKYFIVVEETTGELITPECKKLSLDLELFTEPEEMDEYEMIEDGSLTKGQVDTYYKELDKDEEILNSFAKGHLMKQFNGIEPQYISTYRRMLTNPDTMPSIMLRTVSRRGKIRWTELIELLIEYGYKGTGGSLNASLIMLHIDGYVCVEGKGDDKTIFIV